MKIVDCTPFPHGSTDTRYSAKETGVRKADMRMYPDAAGNITRNAWSTDAADKKV